jgi:hypothetical protein
MYSASAWLLLARTSMVVGENRSSCACPALTYEPGTVNLQHFEEPCDLWLSGERVGTQLDCHNLDLLDFGRCSIV